MRKVWGCTEMSAALFDLDNDGTLEILISRANIKKITRVTVAEPGRKTAKIFLPDVPPLESEWELNPGRCTCEHFRCKKCHFINCVAVKYCGECGARMKNAGVTEFYISHKKWHEVQQKVPYSVQHLKYLRNVALAQLGRNLERLPECAALLSRALNTREEQRRADAWAEGDILL